MDATPPADAERGRQQQRDGYRDRGFTVDETGENGQPAAEPIAAMTRDYLASLPPGQFPNLVALADHFAISDQDLRFEVLINLFVDGLACRIALERGRSPCIGTSSDRLPVPRPSR